MLNVDQIIELNIKDIAFGGNGVGQAADGMTVFVPYSATGDKLKVQITKVKKKFAEATIVEILEKSPDRVEPTDKLYGEHSASQYEHISYEAQLRIKTSQFMSQLQRIGGINPEECEISPITQSPDKYYYRNKICLHPVRATEDYLNYGFYGADNRTVVPVRESSLANEKLNELLPKINKTKWGRKNASRERPLDCTLRVTTEGETHLYFGTAPINYIWLKETINEREVRVPLGSFFQVNIPVAEKMFTEVAGWIKDSGVKYAIDAYCGVGVFSLHLPSEMKVTAFDIDEKAIEAAYHNTMQWGLDNRTFMAGKDNSIFNTVMKKSKPAKTAIILDPPRNGCCRKVLDQLCKHKFHTVAMVSCHPATFARDMKELMEKGNYKISKLSLYDMFPQTSHFECAALLVQKDA